jgi:hypothetical protein
MMLGSRRVPVGPPNFVSDRSVKLRASFDV